MRAKSIKIIFINYKKTKRQEWEIRVNLYKRPHSNRWKSNKLCAINFVVIMYVSNTHLMFGIDKKIFFIVLQLNTKFCIFTILNTKRTELYNIYSNV